MRLEASPSCDSRSSLLCSKWKAIRAYTYRQELAEIHIPRHFQKHEEEVLAGEMNLSLRTPWNRYFCRSGRECWGFRKSECTTTSSIWAVIRCSPLTSCQKCRRRLAVRFQLPFCFAVRLSIRSWKPFGKVGSGLPIPC